ncbi:Mitochondrial escape protein 2 [Cyberlindnera fabianii]|nr:Mitochondrial escape protein 2 [Cyberlindnera fabianii]
MSWSMLKRATRLPLAGSALLPIGARSLPLTKTQLPHRRWVSTEDIKQQDKAAGESVDAEETGVIEKTRQESLMYFDRILPFRTSNWDLRQWFSYIVIADKRPEAIKDHVMALANPVDETTQTPSIPNLEITEVIPMKRDGGAFIKFRVPQNWTIADLNKQIQLNTLKESSKRLSILNWISQASAFSVKGQPWIEDLRRYPSRTIKVKFEGPALTEEELYSLFRRYGSIVDIQPDPAVATVIFKLFRGSICAKNCITGIKINDTVLHISYEKQTHKSIIVDLLTNHTRLAIPVIIALLATLAVIIFDPIREFFIENHITNKFAINRNNPIVKWIMNISNKTMSQIHQFLGQEVARQNKNGGLWSERRDIVRELRLWIEENVNTFIVVLGPRGTGKQDLVVTHALHDRKDILYIDCDKLVKSRSDTAFIRNAAASLGYFPVFPWLNSISTIIDLALTSLTGQKSGLSESKESQYRNMLSTALVAIREISLRGYKATIQEGDTEINVKEEDYLQQHPEKKPVIVIDRFTTINKSESNNFVYKEIADWAALLTTMNIAHVIFLTEDVSTQQLLTDSLPDQVFKYVMLRDASKSAAKSYVLHSLHEDLVLDKNGDGEVSEEEFKKLSESKRGIAELEAQLDACLEPIGGRMLDLQAFVRRVRSGEGPLDALQRMVDQTSEQITQMFLNKDQGIKNAQAWVLIKMLADNDSVNYREFINHPLFKSSPEASLVELEQHGLISMSRDRGVLCEVRPAKPIFKAAFKNLLREGSQIANVLETAYLNKIITFETARIQKFEKELESLAYCTGKKEFNGRLQYLAGKIDACNNNILKAEDDIKKINSKT